MNITHIHTLDSQAIEKIPFSERLANVVEGLLTQELLDDGRGCYSGIELRYKDFCITILDTKSIVVFKSTHDGFWSPNYLELTSTQPEHKFLSLHIKESIDYSLRRRANRLKSYL